MKVILRDFLMFLNDIKVGSSVGDVLDPHYSYWEIMHKVTVGTVNALLIYLDGRIS